MRRGRRALSSNNSLDLTPMLDVVFLVLFVVVIAYAKTGSQAAISETELENTIHAYEHATEQYAQLLDKVELLTLSCTYSSNYPRYRAVTVLSDGEPNPKYQDNFDNNTRRTHMEKLKIFLEEYIAAHTDKLIFVELDDSNVLHKDYEDISVIISKLKEKYPETVRG